MKPLRFTKMQGIGNDFMIVDGLTQDVSMSPSQISQLASRTTGVGFDQLLVVEAPTHPSADFFYRIYNADGTAAGQCGNGARCFAKYVYDKRLNPKRSLTLQTETSRLTTKRLSANEFKVSLEAPQFDPEMVPFKPTGQSHPEGSKWSFEPPGQASVQFGVCNVGNPHAVLLLPSAAPSDLSEWATALITAHSFPEGVNVGFMEVMSEHEVRLRVFERGAGETLGCGSGACAAVAVGRQWQILAPSVKVHMPGGTLSIAWQGGKNKIEMTGPAIRVFEGSAHLSL